MAEAARGGRTLAMGESEHVAGTSIPHLQAKYRILPQDIVRAALGA